MGFFQKQGINLEFTELQSGSTAQDALIGGSVDLVDSASTEVAAAVAKGIPLMAVEDTVNMTLEVCARKDFMDKQGITPNSTLQQKMAAFKGASLAITGPGAVSDRALRWMLQKYGGLNPDLDTQIVQVGGATALLGAINQDRVQGFLQSPPNCEQSVAQGASEVLVPPSEVPEFKNYVHEVLYTSSDWASAHKDLLTRAATAVAMGNNFIIAYPDQAIALLQKDFSSVDPQIVNDTLRQIVFPQVPRDGRMTPDMWSATNTVLVESGLTNQPLDTADGTVWTNAYLGDASLQ